MRFRLVEDINPNLGKYIDEWESIDDTIDEKKQASAIMQDYLGIKDLNGNEWLRKLIDESIKAFSLNPKKNPFLRYLLTLKNEHNFSDGDWSIGDIDKNLEALKNRALAGDNLSREEYYDEGILQGPYKEFTYVINVADVLRDRSKAKKYFGNVANKGIENLFVDNDLSNQLKEIGIGSNDEDTIYGLIDKWTKESGAKDNQQDQKSKNNKSSKEPKFSVRDAMDNIKSIDTSDIVTDEEYLQRLQAFANRLKSLLYISLPLREIADKGRASIDDFINNKVLEDTTYETLYKYLETLDTEYAKTLSNK